MEVPPASVHRKPGVEGSGDHDSWEYYDALVTSDHHHFGGSGHASHQVLVSGSCSIVIIRVDTTIGTGNNHNRDFFTSLFLGRCWRRFTSKTESGDFTSTDPPSLPPISEKEGGQMSSAIWSLFWSRFFTKTPLEINKNLTFFAPGAKCLPFSI